MTPRFDPTRAVVFDLVRGQLRDDEGAARLNLPASVVLRLCESAGAGATLDFARGLGAEVGRRIADRLGAEAAAAPVASWLEHLGGHLAVLGLGNLRLERWGRAMVLRVGGLTDAWAPVVGGILEGALSRALSRNSELVAFSVETDVAFLVLSPDTAGRARALRDSGQALGSVVAALHQGVAS